MKESLKRNLKFKCALQSKKTEKLLMEMMTNFMNNSSKNLNKQPKHLQINKKTPLI